MVNKMVGNQQIPSMETDTVADVGAKTWLKALQGSLASTNFLKDAEGLKYVAGTGTALAPYNYDSAKYQHVAKIFLVNKKPDTTATVALAADTKLQNDLRSYLAANGKTGTDNDLADFVKSYQDYDKDLFNLVENVRTNLYREIYDLQTKNLPSQFGGLLKSGMIIDPDKLDRTKTGNLVGTLGSTLMDGLLKDLLTQTELLANKNDYAGLDRNNNGVIDQDDLMQVATTIPLKSNYKFDTIDFTDEFRADDLYSAMKTTGYAGINFDLGLTEGDHLVKMNQIISNDQFYFGWARKHIGDEEALDDSTKALIKRLLGEVIPPNPLTPPEIKLLNRSLIKQTPAYAAFSGISATATDYKATDFPSDKKVSDLWQVINSDKLYYVDTSFSLRITAKLNNILIDRELYTKWLIKYPEGTVNLPAEAVALINSRTTLPAEDVIVLNRMLLEATYPSSCPLSSFKQIDFNLLGTLMSLNKYGDTVKGILNALISPQGNNNIDQKTVLTELAGYWDAGKSTERTAMTTMMTNISSDINGFNTKVNDSISSLDGIINLVNSEQGSILNNANTCKDKALALQERITKIKAKFDNINAFLSGPSEARLTTLKTGLANFETEITDLSAKMSDYLLAYASLSGVITNAGASQANLSLLKDFNTTLNSNLVPATLNSDRWGLDAENNSKFRMSMINGLKGNGLFSLVHLGEYDFINNKAGGLANELFPGMNLANVFSNQMTRTSLIGSGISLAGTMIGGLEQEQQKAEDKRKVDEAASQKAIMETMAKNRAVRPKKK
ncbi:MAG: hypothetical protein WC838_03995 [Candidatus Margulisiibacteriota bacterium]